MGNLNGSGQVGPRLVGSRTVGHQGPTVEVKLNIALNVKYTKTSVIWVLKLNTGDLCKMCKVGSTLSGK